MFRRTRGQAVEKNIKKVNEILRVPLIQVAVIIVRTGVTQNGFSSHDLSSLEELIGWLLLIFNQIGKKKILFFDL